MDLRNYTRRLGVGTILIALSFSLFAADLPSLYVPEPEEDQPVKECCYTHPNYQGVCVVVPADDETCNGILQYLNTPATVGKTYCDNTRIRGGWEQIQCPEEE
jgi:hypothetical protein